MNNYIKYESLDFILPVISFNKTNNTQINDST